MPQLMTTTRGLFTSDKNVHEGFFLNFNQMILLTINAWAVCFYSESREYNEI